MKASSVTAAAHRPSRPAGRRAIPRRRKPASVDHWSEKAHAWAAIIGAMLNVALKLPHGLFSRGGELSQRCGQRCHLSIVAAFLRSHLRRRCAGAGDHRRRGQRHGSADETGVGLFYDRSQRAKGWLIIGYTLPALSRPLIALASSTPVVLLLRMGDRIGKGLRTSPRDALLAAAVPADCRGLAYGLHRSMDHAGAVAGRLLLPPCSLPAGVCVK